MKAWIMSNLNDNRLEEVEVPTARIVAEVARWMSGPDDNNPSVIRWLSDGVTTVWPKGRTNITVQWHYLADGVGEVLAGLVEALDTQAVVFEGKNPILEARKWQELGGQVKLPSHRPLIVLAHQQLIRDGQHRVGQRPRSPAVALALAYAYAFLTREVFASSNE